MRRDPKSPLTAALMVGAVLLGSTACGSETTGTGAQSPAPSQTSGSATTPAPTDGTETPAASGLTKTVTLVQAGGFAGVKDRIEVRPDGTYTVTSKGKPPRQAALDQRQLTTIARMVDQADLPALATQPPVTSTVTVSDEFTYVLSADGATLKTTETTLPDLAKPLVAELKTLLSEPAPTP